MPASQDTFAGVSYTHDDYNLIVISVFFWLLVVLLWICVGIELYWHRDFILARMIGTTHVGSGMSLKQEVAVITGFYANIHETPGAYEAAVKTGNCRVEHESAETRLLEGRGLYPCVSSRFLFPYLFLVIFLVLAIFFGALSVYLDRKADSKSPSFETIEVLILLLFVACSAVSCCMVCPIMESSTYERTRGFLIAYPRRACEYFERVRRHLAARCLRRPLASFTEENAELSDDQKRSLASMTKQLHNWGILAIAPCIPALVLLNSLVLVASDVHEESNWVIFCVAAAFCISSGFLWLWVRQTNSLSDMTAEHSPPADHIPPAVSAQQGFFCPCRRGIAQNPPEVELNHLRFRSSVISVESVIPTFLVFFFWLHLLQQSESVGSYVSDKQTEDFINHRKQLSAWKAALGWCSGLKSSKLDDFKELILDQDALCYGPAGSDGNRKATIYKLTTKHRAMDEIVRAFARMPQVPTSDQLIRKIRNGACTVNFSDEESQALDIDAFEKKFDEMLKHRALIKAKTHYGRRKCRLIVFQWWYGFLFALFFLVYVIEVAAKWKPI